jgi:Tol biopolymer transport system component
MKKLLSLLCSISFVFFLQGCGGGSSSDSDPNINEDQNPDDDPNPATESSINGTLTGRLFLGDKGSYIDLSTGKQSTLAYGDALISPSPDGTEYVSMIKEVRLEDDPDCYGFGIDIDRVEIRDTVSRLINDSFEVYEDLWGEAKISPDHQMIAVEWASRKGCPGSEVESLLTLFSRTGEILDQATEEVGDFTWLPDNRLVYVNNGDIVVSSSPHRISGSSIVSLTEIPGYPVGLKVSPAGDRLVFEMMTGGPMLFETVTYRNATVWSVDIDGSNLQMVATTRRTDDPDTDLDDPRINNPFWSLDGHQIVMTEGYLSGVMITPDELDLNPNSDYVTVPVETKGLMYAVDASKSGQQLPPDGSIQARVVVKKDDYGDIVPLVASSSEVLNLVPADTAPEATPGSMPEENNSINRGLSGTIFYVAKGDESADLMALDLSNGSTTKIMKFHDEPDNASAYTPNISPDGQIVAFHEFKDGDDSNSIIILDRNGNQLRNNSLKTDDYDYFPMSRLGFSPSDSNLLLFEYSDFSGDFENYVALYDWNMGEFVTHFRDREYYNPVWTPEGNILFHDAQNRFYLTTLTGRQVSEQTQLFSLPQGEIKYTTLSPDGSRLAFEMEGNIWCYNLNSEKLTQVTVQETDTATQPSWSPDGKYLIFTLWQDRSEGPLWIVAADAEYVRVGDDRRGAFKVEYGDDRYYHDVFEPVIWR